MTQIQRKKDILKLERKLLKLREQVVELSNHHTTLLVHHRIVSGWCEGLSSLKQWRLVRQEQQCPPNLAAGGQLDLLLGQGSESFLQLNDLSTEAIWQMQVYPAVSQSTGQQTIAPVAQPMAYFIHLASRPPLPEAANMTVMELLRNSRAVVMDVSMHMHALNSVVRHTGQHPMDLIRVAWDRHFHLMMSLIVHSRHEVAESLSLYNLHTLQPIADARQVELDGSAAATALISTLGLTEQQHNMLATGLATFEQHLEKIKSSKHLLHGQLAAEFGGSSGSMRTAGLAAAIWAKSSSSSSSSGCSSGGTSNSNISSSQADCFSSWSRQHELQQQRLQDLEALLRTECLTHFASMLWFVGSLTWLQLSKIVALSWPYWPNFGLLAAAARKSWQARMEAGKAGKTQQQQQQQQQ